VFVKDIKIFCHLFSPFFYVMNQSDTCSFYILRSLLFCPKKRTVVQFEHKTRLKTVR